MVDWQVDRVGLLQRACLLARIRLTRTAAERGPVLSGACRPGCALLHHDFVLACVVALRLRTGPHSPYEDGR